MLLKLLNCLGAIPAQTPVLGWIQYLINHIRWSAESCHGNTQLLREMVKSTAYHVSNKHRDFPGLQKFKQCAHPPMFG